jgi:hypothetical protein
MNTFQNARTDPMLCLQIEKLMARDIGDMELVPGPVLRVLLYAYQDAPEEPTEPHEYCPACGEEL